MTETSPPPDRRQALVDWWHAQPTWIKVMLLLSAAAVVVGGALMLGGVGRAPATVGGTGSGPGASLLPGHQPAPGEPVPSAGPDPSLSFGVFRLGFSFFAGLCLGAFLRAMAKVAVIAFGFWLLLTMLLGWFDLLTVNWQGIDQAWTRFWASVEWGSLQRFLTGSLPVAGLATLGLYAGLRRH